MYLIELPAQKSMDVLSQFKNDYNELCDYLDVQKNRLVILNPQKKTKKKKVNRISQITKPASNFDSKGVESVAEDQNESPIKDFTQETI